MFKFMDDILRYHILIQIGYLDLLQFCNTNKHYHTFLTYKHNEILHDMIRFNLKTIKYKNCQNTSIYKILHEIYGKIIQYINKYKHKLPLWANQEKFVLIETKNCLIYLCQKWRNDINSSIYNPYITLLSVTALCTFTIPFSNAIINFLINVRKKYSKMTNDEFINLLYKILLV
jgi:hypothetical protein